MCEPAGTVGSCPDIGRSKMEPNARAPMGWWSGIAGFAELLPPVAEDGPPPPARRGGRGGRAGAWPRLV